MESNSKRSRSGRESGTKKEKKSSHKEQSYKRGPKFGDLVPRKNATDDLRLYANKILGDYQSTVESLATDHNGLLGVDRSQPITPLPTLTSENVFDRAMKDHHVSSDHRHSRAADVGRPHSKPHSLPHPLCDFTKHTKKRKKSHHHDEKSGHVKVEPMDGVTEHAQMTSLPNPAIRQHQVANDEERKKKEKHLKRSRKDKSHLAGDHVTSSNSHVTASTSHMIQHDLGPKPSKLLIDTSSLDSSDLQSIKDLINLPPFITPIHTPVLTQDSPFLFSSSASFNPSQNTASHLSAMHDHSSSTNKYKQPNIVQSHKPSTNSLHSIIGNLSSSSSSSGSSSDSDSDDDDNVHSAASNTIIPANTNDNTTLIIEQIRNECNPPAMNLITPIKATPIGQHPLSLIDNDERANLSPAKMLPIKPAPSVTMETVITSDSDTSSDQEDSDSSDSNDEWNGTQPFNHQNGNEDGTTQPFEVNTFRQCSKPFDYNPDLHSPLEPNNATFHGSKDVENEHKKQPEKRNPITRQSSRESSTSLSRQRKPSNGKRKWKEEEDKSNKKMLLTDKDRSLIVCIPFSKVPELHLQQKSEKTKPRPQATVGPYNISSDHQYHTKTESSGKRNRTGFDKEMENSYREDYHGNRRGSWSMEFDANGSREDKERWGKERYGSTPPPSNYRGNDGYYRDGRGGFDALEEQQSERSRSNAEYYFTRAKALKREADNLPQTNGVSKALKYMQSVAFFVKHGHAQENVDSKETSSGVNKAYKIYGDIVSMIRYCMKIGNDCKPLIILCLKCHSALLWRMYTLKHSHMCQMQKDLQDVFNNSSTTAKFHQKSPIPTGNFSPLPSPASVGSTTSSCSGPTSSVNNNNSIEQSTSINKSTSSKLSEYLTVTGYVNQSIELWRQSDAISKQYKDFFVNLDRKIGVVTQFSSLPDVANWIDAGLQIINNQKY